MLLQSHMGEIELLPALPESWASGSIKGLRARGGYEVDVAWKDGKLDSVVVRNVSGADRCKVRLGQKVVEIKVRRGNAVSLNEKLKTK